MFNRKSIAGYKEIEYEVMRDKMIMPLLFVTWKISIQLVYMDSIVVAPSQTLSDVEYQMLRDVSLNVIRALGIEGVMYN